jgi:type IV pilus assembly protein PilX
MKRFRHPSFRAQRGVALVIGLIFLVLVSLIATVSMRQSITQERMAGGLRNDSLARNGAETAARAGERSLYDWYLRSNGQVLTGDEAGSDGVYGLDDTTAEDFREASPVTFFTAGADAVSTSIVDYTTITEPTARLAEQPVFLVEEIGPVRPQGAGRAVEGGVTGPGGYQGQGAAQEVRIYRITARATGGIDTVVRTVETTFVSRPQG